MLSAKRKDQGTKSCDNKMFLVDTFCENTAVPALACMI